MSTTITDPADARPSLTKEEAHDLNTRIKRAVDAVWPLLLEAYERQIWLPLGYHSWRHYATNEFEMSAGHLYRLLDQGRVIKALEAATLSPVGDGLITERVARDLKPHLDTVVADVRDRVVNRGEDPVQVVKAVAASVITTRKAIAATPVPIEVQRVSQPPTQVRLEVPRASEPLIKTPIMVQRQPPLQPPIERMADQIQLATIQIERLCTTIRKRRKSIARAKKKPLAERKDQSDLLDWIEKQLDAIDAELKETT